MKKMNFWITILVLGAASSAIYAADAPSASAAGFKLAVIDFQKALNSVEEGKAAKAKLKSEFESKQKELDRRKTNLDKLQTDLEGMQKQMQSGLLKPEQTSQIAEQGRKKEMEFRKQLEEFTEMGKKHQQDISEKEMKATQEILARLKTIVQDLGRTENFTLVLEQNASGLVYASSYTDLTEKLIQKYNQQYKLKN